MKIDTGALEGGDTKARRADRPLPYLLKGRKLQEPSRMNWEEATELLDFWYDRQENCWDVTFEFYGWWSKADKEVKPLVEKMAEEEGGGQGKKNPGGKAKIGASTRQKSGVPNWPKGTEAKTIKGIWAKKTGQQEERAKNLSNLKANRLGKKGVPPELKKAKEVDSERSTYEEPDSKHRPVMKTRPCKQPAADSAATSPPEPAASSLAQAAVNLSKETNAAEVPSAS
ncbi:hypothetical protein EDB19DRAFT_2038989 [Suillus lakei]|nr:hypothetical protein EDB19DRAFT_2038989 [Suillus lakei]